MEIKVTIGRKSIERAVEALGLNSPDGEARRIFFLEGRGTSRESGLVLADQGVILRLREKGGKGADSTVKFRPFDPMGPVGDCE